MNAGFAGHLGARESGAIMSHPSAGWLWTGTVPRGERGTTGWAPRPACQQYRQESDPFMNTTSVKRAFGLVAAAAGTSGAIVLMPAVASAATSIPTHAQTVSNVSTVSHVSRVGDWGHWNNDPCNPCDPCNQWRPCNPCDQWKPCDPCDQWKPCDPCSPCDQWSPCDPCDPSAHGGFLLENNNETVTVIIHKQEEKKAMWGAGPVL
jgi:hypothetical protein